MKLLYILLSLLLLLLIWSGINPKEQFTWFLEVAPAVIGVLILILTFKKFQFTNLVYILIFFQCAILIIGGHYTYAEVPLFDWIRDTFHQSRNNYDKLGHFAQGFVPAMIARELVLRKKVVLKKNWLFFIVVCIALAISAAYELIEWGVSVLSGEGGDSFLGTQGYIWDTQSDMLFALIGAILAVIILSRIHDKQISKCRK
ncbi:DUF2238 domain-containing protein [Aequorivita sp. H23M31]|uniref:DUF2238 domain-containing protein n=1 Tax=Aequorivita ciconiae TaxID=2494375 RepID=A0A410G5E2_9FLAO|nr:DUF2238 domain-containing protein [Aequorivita sp. H23M31]QAA82415.1 DUF2238 domain-containing protein [Aequorivita sp. H23M31]